MKNKEELELRVLKHFVTSPKALNRAIALNIKPIHFSYKEEMVSDCYHSHIYKMMLKYFEESGGLVLTKNVMENRLVKAQVTDVHKMRFVLLWEKIQEQDYDENDLYDLLVTMKQNLALTFMADLFKMGHETMTEEGVEAAVLIIKDQLENIDTELMLTERDIQEIDVSEGAEYFEKEYKKRRDHPELYRGVYCGLKHIDNKTFGFGNAQLNVVLAPSSGGKSVQLLNWSSYAHIHEGKNILYFSFEMSLWLCLLRHISLVFRIPFATLKSITVPPDELLSLVEKMKDLKDGPYFEYKVNMEDPTPEYVDTCIRELIATKGKPDMVVVDYIGNMTTRETRKEAKPWEKQGEAFQKLFVLAKRYQIPFLTAQQVNRENIRENRKAKEAGKSQTYSQDGISGDSTVIHLAHYVIAMEPDKENRMVTYHAVKMRDAEFEPFSARVDPSHNGIYELTEEEQEEYDIIRNSGVVVKNSESDAPKVASGENNSTIVQTGKITNIYAPEDLEINSIDEWEIESIEE